MGNLIPTILKVSAVVNIFWFHRLPKNTITSRDPKLTCSNIFKQNSSSAFFSTLKLTDKLNYSTKLWQGTIAPPLLAAGQKSCRMSTCFELRTSLECPTNLILSEFWKISSPSSPSCIGPYSESRTTGFIQFHHSTSSWWKDAPDSLSFVQSEYAKHGNSARSFHECQKDDLVLLKKLWLFHDCWSHLLRYESILW